MIRLHLMLILVVAAACFYSVQGQYGIGPMESSSTHISAPVQTLIEGKIPGVRYPGTQQQSAPSSQGLASLNGVGPSLWIQGDGGWTHYATIPQGSIVTLIAVSPSAGNGNLIETINGTSPNLSFYFYPNSQLNF